MKQIVRVLLSAASLTAATSALAQQQPVPATNPESVQTDGDIVVTALRRESTVQNIGATIAVLSADALEKSGTNGSMALQFQTPGVVISQDLGLQTQVYIRGIGSNLQGIAVSNSVATYVDGVYVPNTIQTAQSFNNVERVEVLKGPQATLYGRNATGGAINVVTRRPSFTFGGKADASYGNYNDIQLRGSITGPIVADKIAASLALQYQDHDGYAENLFNGKDLLALNTFGIRGAVLIKPIDDISLLLRADYTRSRGSDFMKLTPGSSVYYIGATQWYDPRPRKVYYDIQNDQPSRDYGVSLTAEWNSPIGKVTSLTSYRWFNAGPIYFDSDQVASPGTYFPAGVGRLGDIVNSESLYHETYVATDATKTLSVIVGGTYFSEKSYELKRQQGPSLAVPRTNTDRFANNDAVAGYIDGTLRVSDKFNVVAGVRYTHETRDYNFYRLLPVGAPTLSSASFSNWSPRFGVEYRPSNHILLFATATSGFKSGGFNSDTPSNGFAPETIWSYEGGIKTTLSNQLRLNASAFYYDYKDIQVLQYVFIGSVISPLITNAGSAKLYGADLTADWRATPKLTLGAGVSLLHSEFGSAVFCDPLFGSCTATNPADRPNVNVRGKQLPRAPGTTANFYADYKIPMGGDIELSLRGDASYRAKTYYTVFQNDLYAASAFWMFNANARLSFGKYFVEAYGQNLSDKLAVTQIINSSPLRNAATGALTAGTPARFERYASPRTYGLRVGVKF